MRDSRIVTERIAAGLARAKLYGRMGGRPKQVSDEAVRAVITLPSDEAARQLGISQRQFCRRRQALETPAERKARLAIKRVVKLPPKRAKSALMMNTIGLTNKQAAAKLGVSVSTLIRRRRALEEKLAE